MPSTLSSFLRSRAFWVIAAGVLIGGVVFAFVLASGDGGQPTESTTSSLSTTTTETPSTSSTVSTTTTSQPASTGDVSPINGLPVDDPALLDRRVLAVKVDNHLQARPQSGVDKADMVIELMVEGITRFLTIWQQSDIDYLGPVRSGRPTDPTLLTAFNEPTFAISGAQAWVQGLIRSKGVHLIGEVQPATFRIGARSAPHNLYANTSLYREYADSRGYPDNPPNGPIWNFGPVPDTAQPAQTVRMDFSGNTVSWDWDPGTATWLRTADGRESMWRDQDGTTGRIGFPVLVALYVELYTVSPPNGQPGTALPSSHTTGTGKAFVFADGKVVEGTWARDSEADWFTLTSEDGSVIDIPPGQVWVALVPDTLGLTYS